MILEPLFLKVTDNYDAQEVCRTCIVFIFKSNTTALILEKLTTVKELQDKISNEAEHYLINVSRKPLTSIDVKVLCKRLNFATSSKSPILNEVSSLEFFEPPQTMANKFRSRYEAFAS